MQQLITCVMPGLAYFQHAAVDKKPVLLGADILTIITNLCVYTIITLAKEIL